MKFCDLHLHTVYSDSTYTPKELLKRSAAAGLGAIAVTDHDTVNGVAPAIEEASAYNIEVIPAIELTAESQGLEIHILGYFIEYRDSEFLKQLRDLKEIRVQRVYKIIEKLKSLGVSLNADTVFGLSCDNGSVGRLHIARALVKEGHCKSLPEAFDRYIGDRSPAYVCGFRFSPSEVIRLIRNTAQGVCVLAHPYSLHKDDMILSLVEDGIQGLEVFYPEHSSSMTKHYKNIAQKYDLLLTGGSDCHGDAKPEPKIGSVKIPYELVEKLKAARKRMP